MLKPLLFGCERSAGSSPARPPAYAGPPCPQVLGDASLAASFELSDMQDGVVALRTREQAERFAASLVDPEHRDTAYSDVRARYRHTHQRCRRRHAHNAGLANSLLNCSVLESGAFAAPCYRR